MTSMRGAFGKDVSVLFASSKLPRNLVSRFAAYTLAKLNHCPGDAFWMIRPKLSSSSLQGPAIGFPSQPCHQAGRTDGPQVQDSPPGPPMSPEGWHFPTVQQSLGTFVQSISMGCPCPIKLHYQAALKPAPTSFWGDFKASQVAIFTPHASGLHPQNCLTYYCNGTAYYCKKGAAG